MKQISIQIQKSDKAFIDDIEAISAIECTRLETSSFDGQSEIISLLVVLAPLVVEQLSRVITEQLKAKRYLKIVYKGTQIQGMSDKEAARILEKLIESERAGDS